MDQKIILKETLEKVKKENIMLDIELTQYQLFGLNNKPSDHSIQDFNTDLHKSKIDLESNKAQYEKLKNELYLKGKEKIKSVPKWSLNA